MTADLGAPSLIPETPRDPSSDATAAPEGRRWVEVGVGVGLFALAVVVPLFRQQGNPAWATLWAEDGTVYLEDITSSGIGAVMRGSDGYVQFVPRLLMLPSALLPIEQAARWAALVATVTQAILAALVYRWSGDHISSKPVRLGLAAMYVVAPQMREDGTANAANVLAPLLAAAPWALLSRHRGRLDVAARALLLLATGLSSVIALVFVPLGALVAWRRRDRVAYLMAGALTAGVVIQQLFIRFSAPRHPSAPQDILQLPKTTALNMFGSWLLGMWPLTDLWLRLAWTLLVLSTVVGIAVLVIALIGASDPARRLAAVFLVYAPLTYMIPVWANGSTSVGVYENLPPNLSYRYAVAPVIFLVSAMAVLLAPPDPTRFRRIARVGRVVMLVQLAVVMVTSFNYTNDRSRAVPWKQAVLDARSTCVVTGARSVELPISPDEWVVELPCTRLVPSGS